MNVENLLSPYLQLADAVIVTDKDHVVVAVNDAYEQITGYKKDFIVGRRAGVIKSHLTPEQTYASMKKALSEKSLGPVFL